MTMGRSKRGVGITSCRTDQARRAASGIGIRRMRCAYPAYPPSWSRVSIDPRSCAVARASIAGIKSMARAAVRAMFAWSMVSSSWPSAQAAAADTTSEATAAAEATSPWSFNLTPYLWLPGVTGSYRAGPKSKAVDVNFINIADNLDSFPLAFMGRFEAHYERFGFYLDGVYANLNFKDRTGPHGLAGVGLTTDLGVMDYGLMYRLFGASPADRSNWQGKKTSSNRLDVYVGGRTLWLTNTLDPKRVSERSASATLTAPIIGGRFGIDINPDWFVMADGNLGGFGADNVSFTGNLQGMVGYRFHMGELPASAELGYRALRITTEPTKRIETNTTLHGPFVGLSMFW